MTYSATAYRLLISAPGDIPSADQRFVIDAIGRWNVMYGTHFGAVVVPVYWQAHSAAKHGARPQATLNDQLVKPADIVLALFWHRLGTATGVAESGTVEEIEEAERNGAYVAILHCERDWPQSADPSQITRMKAFFERMRDSSLMLGYTSEADLARHVDAVLSQAVSRASALAGAVVTTPLTGAEVWPRVETSELLETDARGRARTRRRWSLVLSNTGGQPARSVRYRLEAEKEGDGLPLELGDERELETLAPGGAAAYGLHLHAGVAPQVRCVVEWEDTAGPHTNWATLRFF